MLLVEILRTAIFGKKIKKLTTPLKEPCNNDKIWEGKKLVMVIGHQGSGKLQSALQSHYISFVKLESGAWWRIDTGTQTITEENPFQTQITSHDDCGFTINFLVFKDVP